jgi:hypothetical protein
MELWLIWKNNLQVKQIKEMYLWFRKSQFSWEMEVRFVWKLVKFDDADQYA